MAVIGRCADAAFWLMEHVVFIFLVGNGAALEGNHIRIGDFLLRPFWRKAIDQYLVFADVLFYLSAGSDSHICQVFIKS